MTTSADLPKPTRTAILTILCIASFTIIFSTIVANITFYLGAERIAGYSDSVLEKSAEDEHADTEENLDSEPVSELFTGLREFLQPRVLRVFTIINTISAIIYFIGTWLMWKLRRAGYYIYCAGVLLDLIAPFFLIKNVVFHDLMFLFAFLLEGLICTLYAFQLKYMK